MDVHTRNNKIQNYYIQENIGVSTIEEKKPENCFKVIFTSTKKVTKSNIGQRILHGC